jgi:transcription initiation factor IIE alpha subunit
MHSKIIKDGFVTTLMEHNDECPACGVKINAVTSTDGLAVPQAGDVSVCLKCGSMLEFNEDLTVKLIDLQELNTMEQETITTLKKIQDYIRGTKKNLH